MLHRPGGILFNNLCPPIVLLIIRQPSLLIVFIFAAPINFIYAKHGTAMAFMYYSLFVMVGCTFQVLHLFTFDFF